MQQNDDLFHHSRPHALSLVILIFFSVITVASFHSDQLVLGSSVVSILKSLPSCVPGEMCGLCSSFWRQVGQAALQFSPNREQDDILRTEICYSHFIFFKVLMIFHHLLCLESQNLWDFLRFLKPCFLTISSK